MAYMECIGFQATAPGASGAAATAFSGDSLVIKNAAPGTGIRIIAGLSLNQTAGFQQVTAPSFSDTTRGIRWAVPATTPGSFLPMMMGQPCIAQEALSATIAGSATAGDIELGALLLYYDEIPGLTGVFIGEDELMARMVRMVTVYATLSTGTAGGWSGAELITAESDLLRANTDYALLGLVTSVNALAIGIRAPDWSNGRVAVPGIAARPEVTSDWFRMLSWETGLPLIPVFNSANKNNIYLDAAVDENGLDPVVGVILMELGS